MFRPVKVRSLPNYKIWIQYTDGKQGEVDLSHLVGRGVFALWKDYRKFEQVRIGSGGELVWEDDIDLCPDSIYMKLCGQTPEQVFPGEGRADA